MKKAIEKMPTTAVVKREVLNDFQEPTGEEKEIITVTGFYRKEKSRLNIVLSEGGEYKTHAPNQKFLVVYDDDTKVIQEKDYLIINDKKYKIIDLGEEYGIFMDMTLER